MANEMRLDHSKPRTIEYWFDYGSNYSYLSTMRIETAASAVGARVVWRPMLLGVIFRSFGWETSPFVLQKAKGDYVWADMVRECAKAGVPWKKPSEFPRSAVLPSRVALVGAEAGWIGEFSRRISTANFVDDHDIASREVVLRILEEMRLPAHAIVTEALGEENKLSLRAQTEKAAAQGIFGAPTFFVGNEMFWGNDRLDDALQLLKTH